MEKDISLGQRNIRLSCLVTPGVCRSMPFAKIPAARFPDCWVSGGCLWQELSLWLVKRGKCPSIVGETLTVPSPYAVKIYNGTHDRF
jgi:hypothetical protein